jgi:hypothetical protein
VVVAPVVDPSGVVTVSPVPSDVVVNWTESLTSHGEARYYPGFFFYVCSFFV